MGIRILRRKSKMNVDKASTSTDDQSTDNTDKSSSSSTSSRPEPSSPVNTEFFAGQNCVQNHIKKSKPSVIVELSAKLATLEFFVETMSKKSKINLYSFSNVPGDYETEEKFLGGLSNASVRERIHVFNKYYIHVAPEDYGDKNVDLLFVGDNIAFKNLKIIWDNFTPKFNKKSTAVFLTDGNKNVEAFVNIVLTDDNLWKIKRCEGVAFISRNTSFRKPKNPIPIVINEVKELVSSGKKSIENVSKATKDSADEVSRSAQVSADQASTSVQKSADEAAISAQDSVDQATESAQDSVDQATESTQKSISKAQTRADKAAAKAQAKADKAQAKAKAKADKAQAKADKTKAKAQAEADKTKAEADKVQAQAQAKADIAKAKAEAKADKAKAKAKAKADKAKAKADEAQANAQESVDEAQANAQESVDETQANVQESVDEASTSVQESVASGKQAMKDVVPVIELYKGQVFLEKYIRDRNISTIVEYSKNIMVTRSIIAASKGSEIHLYSISNDETGRTETQAVINGVEDLAHRERIHNVLKYYVNIGPADYGNKKIDLLLIGDDISIKNLEITLGNASKTLSERGVVIYILNSNNNVQRFVKSLESNNSWNVELAEGIAVVSRA